MNSYLIILIIDNGETTHQKNVEAETVEKAIEYLKKHDYNTNRIHSIIKL